MTRSRSPILTAVRDLAAAALLLAVVGCGSPAGPSQAISLPVESEPSPAGVPGAASPSATSAPSLTATSTLAASPDSSALPTAPSPSGGGTGATGIPAFHHVYLIVMENKAYGSIVGSSDAPYLNELIRRSGLATRYTAVAHPSEPNYIALFSGATQGVSDDGVHDLNAPNLADQLEAAGRTWRVFAQNVPLGCYTGAVASGGPDGRGTYARKHEPAISFTSIAGDPGRCANISDFSHVDPTAADFELLVPNMCNDMHDCSVATGDRFLQSFVPKITSDAAFADSVLFITWDEGTDGAGGGGHVATIVVGSTVPAGFTSDVSYSHYSLLRTIQDAWHLGCLRHSCAAKGMSDFFGGG